MAEKETTSTSTSGSGDVKLKTSGFVDNFVLPVKSGEDLVVTTEFKSFSSSDAEKVKKAAKARRVKIVEGK